MQILRSSRTLISCCVTASFLSIAAVLPAQADIVSTPQLAAAAQLDVTRSDVTRLLGRADIQAQMASMGVDPAQISSRIDSLTASELDQLRSGMETLPAAADAGGTILTLLLIFLILDLAGVTDIFPGI